jgi:Zn finger protein HypA/HybF involved in hydrogenase expression
MITCCECDQQFPDNKRGRVNCPNCYSHLIITANPVTNEVSVRTLNVERPKVQKDRRRVGKVIESTVIGTVALGSILCKVCKCDLRSQDEGRLHHLGIVCNSCYDSMPTECICNDCDVPFTIQSGHLPMCPHCHSTDYKVKPILTDSWEKHKLPTLETYTRSTRVVYGDERDMVSDGTYLHGSSLHRTTNLLVKGRKPIKDSTTTTRYNKPGTVVDEVEIVGTPTIKFRKA